MIVALLASVSAVALHSLGALGLITERQQFLWKLTLLFATLVATTLGLTTLYRVASGRLRSGRSILPGAVLASLAFHGVSWVFSTYVRTLAKYTAFYGGLAAVAVLLMWLWLSSLTVLAGAEANAVVDELRGRTPKRRG